MWKQLFLFLCILCWTSTPARGGQTSKGYKAYIDVSLGDAYNFNTAQLISTNNMQLYSMVSSTHGYQFDEWFIGGGVGYYHSFRDGENMYPLYAAGRYSFDTERLKPSIGMRAGIVYDPRWVSKVQAYGALSTGVTMYKRLQVGLRLSLFSRPSRFFTANAAFVFSFEFGN